MEHNCAKCGGMVEEGVPFCPRCRAPQIRVAWDSGAENSAPTGELHADAAVLAQSSGHGFKLEWHRALPAAALGGLAGVLVFLLVAMMGGPGAAIPMLWGPAYALGGAVAVGIYRSRGRGLPLTPGSGAKLGAASAAFGFLVFAIVIVGTFVYDSAEMRKTMTDMINQASAQGYDAQSAKQALDLLKTDEGLGAFVAFALSIVFVLFVAAASLGGAACAWFLRRR